MYRIVWFEIDSLSQALHIVGKHEESFLNYLVECSTDHISISIHL